LVQLFLLLDSLDLRRLQSIDDRTTTVDTNEMNGQLLVTRLKVKLELGHLIQAGGSLDSVRVVVEAFDRIITDPNFIVVEDQRGAAGGRGEGPASFRFNCDGAGPGWRRLNREARLGLRRRYDQEARQKRSESRSN
jgi:hypothetical protein